MKYTAPARWLLLHSTKVRGADPEATLGNCSECGRSLYAAIFYIAEAGKPESERAVGSGCCKRLTGYTPAQLVNNEEERQSALAAEERDRITQIEKREWIEANASILVFLREHAAQAKTDHDAQCADFAAGKRERYPHHNDFWQSFLDYAEQRGTLSEKQMAIVVRVMQRDFSKPLPKVGKRVTVAGKVIASKCEIDEYRSGHGRLAYLAKIDVGCAGLHYRITARDNGKLFTALGLNVNRDGRLAGVAENLAVIGTVKWAGDGLVILNRSKAI